MAKFAVEYQEEHVGVVVGVPDVLALDLGDPDVVVVHPPDDPRAPECGEGGQCGLQFDRFVARPVTLPFGLAGW
jgi:hypothetical protein